MNAFCISFDTTRPHTSFMTRQKLGWEVFLHPPYSLDVAASGYHLILNMANNFTIEKL